MVNLKAMPYNLSDADITWVQGIIASMTPEEKVGQLFWQLTSSNKEEYLQELMEKYHLGGIRYNGMPGQMVLNQNRILQKYAKVPVFIACNPEKGGDGVCPDGTQVGSGVKVGATGKPKYAQAMGRVSGAQIKATGCNMAFAPVVDITYNFECEEVLLRAFGGNPKLVASMGKAYMDGLRETEGVFCCAKHFPGNGQDYRDAHISNNVNHFTHDKWMETYGHVYKTLIDGGLDAIMGGHILMPEYMAEINPEINADTIMPGTLCKEIMTDLLRGELGFNGMVVTDASHMVGMTNRMKRVDMLPAAINAGCDMFLFFNDPAEDYATMLNAYNTGIISEERMTEALSRILGSNPRNACACVDDQEDHKEYYRKDIANQNIQHDARQSIYHPPHPSVNLLVNEDEVRQGGRCNHQPAHEFDEYIIGPCVLLNNQCRQHIIAHNDD